MPNMSPAIFLLNISPSPSLAMCLCCAGHAPESQQTGLMTLGRCGTCPWQWSLLRKTVMVPWQNGGFCHWKMKHDLIKRNSNIKNWNKNQCGFCRQGIFYVHIYLPLGSSQFTLLVYSFCRRFWPGTKQPGPRTMGRFLGNEHSGYIWIHLQLDGFIKFHKPMSLTEKWHFMAFL